MRVRLAFQHKTPRADSVRFVYEYVLSAQYHEKKRVFVCSVQIVLSIIGLAQLIRMLTYAVLGFSLRVGKHLFDLCGLCDEDHIYLRLGFA